MKALLLMILCVPLFAEGPPHTDYEYVAASQTDQKCGPVGGKGDILERLIVIPGTTSPGAVSIEDGTDTARVVYTGGASSITELNPVVIELGIKSQDGAWEITTGANVTAICVGRFK